MYLQNTPSLFTKQFAMSTVDLSTLSETSPSLCIPRVFSNITRDRIFNTLKELNIGFIERIDMVRKSNDKGDDFQRVFIHLRWFRNDVADKARKRLIDGKDIKIVYEDPWFWKVSANRSVSRPTTSQSSPSRGNRRTAPAIQFDYVEDDSHESSMQAIKHRRQMNTRPKCNGRKYHPHKKFDMDSQHKVIASADLHQDLTIKIPSVECEASLHMPCTPPYSPPQVDKEMSEVDVTIGPYGDKEEGEV
jgi:hypothetical protein